MSKNFNGDDIDTLLKITLGRYFDYLKYWNDLADIDELFDESNEYFETQTWSNQLSPKDNALILNAIFSLDKTIDSFKMLVESTENECKKLLGQVLKMKRGKRKQIFGNESENDKAIIDETFMEISEFEYQYNSEEAFEMFIKILNEKLNDKSCNYH